MTGLDDSAVIAINVLVCLSHVWVFSTAGRGTPGLWDPPRRFVAAGPYRRVRKPIYRAALLIVLGEAWLFLSAELLICTAVLVTCYKEPKLRARFGAQ